MATTLAPPKPETRPRPGFGGPNGGGAGNGHFGGGSGDDAHAWHTPARAYHTGMWMALAAIVMLFAAFTSALVVRKGLANDWVRTGLPHILYLNTVVLLVSSFTLELARRAYREARWEPFRSWLYATWGLGVAFIAGQLLAWRELASRGVYLATNPSSSFFYLLTGAHALHLLGGVVALAYLTLRARNLVTLGPKSAAVDVTAVYWHFMDGLWIYILLLFLARL
jgi:cytochrome c oxidase subunit III